ncbi:MAG: lipase [Chloroflexi bacterium]|nr:lipase [Chloroflexota bacterium]|tara:strand:+ start:303 stop:1229 length:927 start_codon:yes stop_codon:yes gene_type:complete
MPLDSQSQAFIDYLSSLGNPPPETISPKEARKNFSKIFQSPGPELHLVEDRFIPSINGEIPIRFYKYSNAKNSPVLVWFHGGGMVVGDLDSADGIARFLCDGSQYSVVSVDYRLAPENKFPAALEDCYNVTKWIYDHAEDFDTNQNQIAVGGDSAGGNLAAAVSIMSRDNKQPHIAHQLLIYPMLDCDFTTKSYIENAEGYLLTQIAMKSYWDHYLNSESDKKNPYALPLQLTDYSNLPSALIITTEFDPLRDEGELYAQRLKDSNIDVELTRYNGVFHGFFGRATLIDKGKLAMEEACSSLIKAFNK